MIMAVTMTVAVAMTVVVATALASHGRNHGQGHGNGDGDVHGRWSRPWAMTMATATATAMVIAMAMCGLDGAYWQIANRRSSPGPIVSRLGTGGLTFFPNMATPAILCSDSRPQSGYISKHIAR